MATGCLRRIEKINICIKLTKMKLLVTDENMGLCLYIGTVWNKCRYLCYSGFLGWDFLQLGNIGSKEIHRA